MSAGPSQGLAGLRDGLRLPRGKPLAWFGVALFVAALGVPAAHAKTKVACIGASTTMGSGAPAGQSYPDQLGRLLGADYEVRNFGKSGAGALRQGDPTYWNSAEFKAATAYAPDVVIDWLGGADSKAASWDAHEGEFLDDYKAMITHFQDLPSHPKVIAMLSIALHDDAGVRKTVLEGEVNPLQRRGAAETGIPMVDLKAVVDGHPEYFADGVHLKAAGYAAVAAAVHPVLLTSFTAPDAGPDAPLDAGAPDVAELPDAAIAADARSADQGGGVRPDGNPAGAPGKADAAPRAPVATPEPSPAQASRAEGAGCALAGGGGARPAPVLLAFAAAGVLLARRRRR